MALTKAAVSFLSSADRRCVVAAMRIIDIVDIFTLDDAELLKLIVDDASEHVEESRILSIAPDDPIVVDNISAEKLQYLKYCIEEGRAGRKPAPYTEQKEQTQMAIAQRVPPVARPAVAAAKPAAAAPAPAPAATPAAAATANKPAAAVARPGAGAVARPAGATSPAGAKSAVTPPAATTAATPAASPAASGPPSTSSLAELVGDLMKKLLQPLAERLESIDARLSALEDVRRSGDKGGTELSDTMTQLVADVGAIRNAVMADTLITHLGYSPTEPESLAETIGSIADVDLADTASFVSTFFQAANEQQPGE